MSLICVNTFQRKITKIYPWIVAEEMHQPLYSMSAGELGETATEVEDSLEVVLELASKWNAILLLDECDMFLEARTTADIRRNRLVSSQLLPRWVLSSDYCSLLTDLPI